MNITLIFLNVNHTNCNLQAIFTTEIRSCHINAYFLSCIISAHTTVFCHYDPYKNRSNFSVSDNKENF